ncbi:MAG: class I SAM-dependent methyltransferase [Kofleriaceae bacterium]
MSREFWDAIAPDEETALSDETINRELRRREIERHLEDVHTILDIGAGTGAFSIPLARRGFAVTHFDVSPEMIARARERAAGIPIEFALGDAADLSRFGTRSFDLVLCMDGAISFSPQPMHVIAEACRVAGQTLIATASNKAAMIATWIKYSMKAAGRLLPAVDEMIETGRWNKDQFTDNALIYPSVCDIPVFQAFDVDEFAARIGDHMNVVTARSIGSLTHLLALHDSPHVVAELCERYDIEVMPRGPGSFRRAGVMVVAKRRAARPYR